MIAPDIEVAARLHYGCLVPASEDYFTQLMIFPGSNAHEPWSTTGSFTLSAKVFSKPGNAFDVPAQSCTERGHLKLDFETALKAQNRNVDGFGVLVMEFTGGIPVEIYLSHIHRKTGVYFAYPALAFMGDLLYPHAHVEQMENSMFWPGFPSWNSNEFRLVLLNPYDVPMSAEVTLWHNAKGRHTVGVRRVSATDCLWMSLDELMPKDWQGDASGAASLGVTAQFKLLAYMVTINRRTGIITSADHLHPYQLF